MHQPAEPVSPPDGGTPRITPADLRVVFAGVMKAGLRGPGPVTLVAGALAGYAAAFALTAAWQPLLVVAVPLLAAAMTVLSVAAHECAHASLFPHRPRLNTAVGFCAGLLTWTPFFGFRRGHAAHHRWAGSGKDPTPTPLGTVRPSRLLDLALRLRLPVLFWGGVYWPYLTYDLRPAGGSRRARHLAECGLTLAATGAVQALLAWVVGGVPYAVLAAGGFLGWGVLYERLFTRNQHLGLLPVPAGRDRYPPAEQVNFSRSTRTRLAWAVFYFNLHKEHHLFPGLHYRYLPLLHERLRERCPDVYAFTDEGFGRGGPGPAHELLSPHPGDRIAPP